MCMSGVLHGGEPVLSIKLRAWACSAMLITLPRRSQNLTPKTVLFGGFVCLFSWLVCGLGGVVWVFDICFCFALFFSLRGFLCVALAVLELTL